MRFRFWGTDKTIPSLLSRVQNPNKPAPSLVTIPERALPKTLPIKQREILPRLKEGGAFVKFSHDPEIQASEIEKTLQRYLKESPVKPWFNPFRRVRAFLVHGKPWVEDLNRFPSSRLKVQFLPYEPGQQAAELSQESLYTLFRQYGKLADIAPQPADSKDPIKFAYLNFVRVRHAVMAKNCMHGYTVPLAQGGSSAGTVLKLGYEQKIKAHWIQDWLFNHPRIVLPLFAALAATFTVAVFDPYD